MWSFSHFNCNFVAARSNITFRAYPVQYGSILHRGGAVYSNVKVILDRLSPTARSNITFQLEYIAPPPHAIYSHIGPGSEIIRIVYWTGENFIFYPKYNENQRERIIMIKLRAFTRTIRAVPQ